MIKFIKDLSLESLFRKPSYFNVIFEFREKELRISSLTKQSYDPSMGCVFDKKSATELIAFLQKCIDDERKDCCWDYKVDDGIVGYYVCPTCETKHTKKDE